MPKTPRERRRRRSPDPLQALRYQLDETRRRGHFDGMVVADEDGLCLAASGETVACDEIAARLPLIARSLDYFEGLVRSPKARWPVRMSRIAIDKSRLFVCAIGGKQNEPSARRQLDRSARGATRILATS